MSERQRALDLALAQIEKQFGKGSIMKLGEVSAKLHAEVISTGALALDLALGIGGVPRGRVVEIYGPEASGKTTLGYHIIAEAQREGGVAAFIDAEHALDPAYAKAVGMDVDNLLLSHPTAESRRWRSPKPWFAAARSTSWSWTRWRRSCRARNSKAKWATPM